MSDASTLEKILQEKHGKGSVVRIGNKVIEPVPVIPTGIDVLDNKLFCCGGVPRGRMIELVGAECVDENTYIPYSTWYNGVRINCKGGTIKKLYEKFNKISKNCKYNVNNYSYQTASVNDGGFVQINNIENVIYSGQKECIQITTESNKSLVCSYNHEIMVGLNQYTKAGNLKKNDLIGVHNNTPFMVPNQVRKNYPEYLVKYHPTNKQKIVTCNNVDYTYFRVRKSHAAYEAFLNNISVEKYISILNSNEALQLFLENKLLYIASTVNIHHKDNDPSNNAIENLELISPTEHGKLHAYERHNNLRYIIKYEKIINIVPVGIKNTYDITMKSPMNNFIANKIAVHNSAGKTTLSLQMIAAAQRQGEVAVFVDVEHALSLDWANRQGVDVPNLLVSQPDSGEEALEIISTCLDNSPAIVVVDSIAAIVPRVELEGEMGDAVMGSQARLMGQACRKLTPKLRKSNTALVWLNQVRDKLGVVWGSPITTPGGRAMKFYASIRASVSKGSQIKKGDLIVGQEVIIKIVKNKLAPPYKEGKIILSFNGGIDQSTDMVEKLIESGEVVKKGAWFLMDGQKFQGKDALVEYIANKEKNI